MPGIANDVLSAYLESLRIDRQSKTADMNMALQMLESQAQMDFRKESRRREDMWRGLQTSRTATQEQIGDYQGQIYTKFLRLPYIEVLEDGEVDIDVKKMGEKGLGFTDAQISDIHTMMVLYQKPATKKEGALLASKIARQAYSEYNYYNEVLRPHDSEANNIPLNLLPFISSGMINLGDESKEKMSLEPFRGVYQGYEVLNNIAAEFSEMMEGDYNIEAGRDIRIDPLKQGYNTEEAKRLMDEALNDQDAGNLADLIEGKFKLGDDGSLIEIEEDKKLLSVRSTKYATGQDVMESIDYLNEEDQKHIQGQVDALSKEIKEKEQLLIPMRDSREELFNQRREYKEKLSPLEDRWKYWRDREGIRGDRAQSIKAEMDKLNELIDQSNLEARSAPGGRYNQGTIAAEMSPIIVQIEKLKRDRSKLGD